MTVLSTLLEYSQTILFYFGIAFLIYINRKSFDKLGTLMYVYRTKLGLSLMENWGVKHRKIVKFLGYVGVVFAYGGFFVITYLLGQEAFKIIIQSPMAQGASPVLPGLPVPGLGVTFPLVIGWISLFIIMVVHEFSHGVVARAHDINVKSSGLAFFGPILGAFVEPDDKELKSKPYKSQLSVFAAGPFSNIILWGVFSLIFLSLYPSNGIAVAVMQNDTMPAFLSDMPQNVTINAINNVEVLTAKKLGKELDKYKPGEIIEVGTTEGSYPITLASNPDDPNDSYIGIWLRGEDRNFIYDVEKGSFEDTLVDFITKILIWTSILSLSIGLMNLFPIFITDGAQILRANMEYLFKNNKDKGQKIWANINKVALILLVILLVPFFTGIVKVLFSIITRKISLF